MKKIMTTNFTHAVRDYYSLINRGYPEKRTRLLVADTYGLSKSQRTVLYRGVFSGDVNEGRSRRRVRRHVYGKETAPAEFQSVAVDYFNVIYTVMNYLLGRFTYISTDGFLRDTGENYTRMYHEEKFLKSAELTAGTCGALGITEAELFIDTGFSIKTGFSIPLGDYGESIFRQNCDNVFITIADSADRLLRASRAAVKASSDSKIIDSEHTAVLDLARITLEKEFSSRFADLRPLVKSR
ncbi:MAG: DUF434 domain-containing protein [Spirochaetia bacterium]